MRKLTYICILLASVMVAACKNNVNQEKKDDTRVLMQDSTDSRGLQRMQVSENKQDILLKGQTYHSWLSRVPKDSLPHVRSEMGDLFVDNEITLRITKEGKPVFAKTFTKYSFANLVDDDFLDKSILEGMVFDKTTPQGFVYAVSVSYPQTDLYIPIAVTIAPDGKISMVKEELMEEIYTEEEE